MFSRDVFNRTPAAGLLNVSHAQSAFNRGKAYQAQGKFSEAIVAYTQAIAWVPSNAANARAYFNRALAYEAQGNLSNAISDHTQALALFTNNEDKAIAYVNRCRAYQAQGKHPEAIVDCGQALKLNPELVKEFLLEDLKHFYKYFYALYLTIRNFLPPRTRLGVCYEGEVTPFLTDRRGTFLLMNKPVILLCCRNTFDLETLENFPNKTCPCCRAPIAESDFNHPIVNLLVQEMIVDYVKEKEDLAEQQRLRPVAAVADHELPEQNEGKFSQQQSLLVADVSLNEEIEGQLQQAPASYSPSPVLSGAPAVAELSPQREAASRQALLAKVTREALVQHRSSLFSSRLHSPGCASK